MKKVNFEKIYNGYYSNSYLTDDNTIVKYTIEQTGEYDDFWDLRREIYTIDNKTRRIKTYTRFEFPEEAIEYADENIAVNKEQIIRPGEFMQERGRRRDVFLCNDSIPARFLANAFERVLPVDKRGNAYMLYDLLGVGLMLSYCHEWIEPSYVEDICEASEIHLKNLLEATFDRDFSPRIYITNGEIRISTFGNSYYDLILISFTHDVFTQDKWERMGHKLAKITRGSTDDFLREVMRYTEMTNTPMN